MKTRKLVELDNQIKASILQQAMSQQANENLVNKIHTIYNNISHDIWTNLGSQIFLCASSTFKEDQLIKQTNDY